MEPDFTRQPHGSAFIEVWMTHLDLCSNCSKSAFDTSTGTRWLDSIKNQPQKIYSVMKKYDDLKNGCSHSAVIFFFFFSRQMFEFGETPLQLFRDTLPAILKTYDNQRLSNDVKQSIGSEFCRHSSLYLSIN